MMRNLVGWVLLLPMMMNGLWVVCQDATAKDTPAPVTKQVANAPDDCATMCPMKHQVDSGAMCLLLPGESKTSITVVDFGVAILTPQIRLEPLARVEGLASELPVSYSNPSLLHQTPPPKA